MSGWLLMGLPGAVYVSGLSESWIAIGLCLGAYLNWRWVAARLRLYTERAGNALTLPDFLANRFEDKSNALRIVTALVILVFFTLYCASGVVAGARLFENMFGMPYNVALWVGAACTIAYVLIGGFLAVSWTDTIQASLMITALLLAPIMAWLALSGDLQQGLDLHTVITAEQFDLFRGASFVGIVSLMAWGLGYFGQPHILVRFMAAASVQTIPKARRISMTWMILCLGGAVAVGFIGIPYFATHAAGAAAVECQRGNRVHGAGQAAVQPLDCRCPAGGHFGGGDEHPVLPAAGVLQRPDRRHLPHLFAQERQPARAGLGGPHHGAAGGADRHRPGQRPQRQGAGHGQLRLGRLWRGVRPGHHPVACSGRA